MTQRRLRVNALVVMLAGVAFLALPPAAHAKVYAVWDTGGRCSACYDDGDSPQCADGNQADLNDDCLEVCGQCYGTATTCMEGTSSNCYPANFGNHHVDCYYTC